MYAKIFAVGSRKEKSLTPGAKGASIPFAWQAAANYHLQGRGMLTLYGSNGCGSAVVEVLLELFGETWCAEMISWDDRAAWEKLAPLNPLKQVPILTSDDGMVLTESLAIVFWLLGRHPDTPINPPADSMARATMYRWLAFIVTNIYPALVMEDFPSRWVEGENAEKSLQQHMRARLHLCWKIMEGNVTPAPYLLGTHMTALDIYVAMVSHWRPGRAWIEENCPKIIGAVKLTEAHPVVANVWARNFA
jgi:GST-like protein